MEGTALTLILASIVPWSTWLNEHPQSTVVTNDLDRGRYGIVQGHDNFVIGVALQDAATAYRYTLAASQRVINDRVGEHPVVVFVDPDTHDTKVYLRRPVLASQDDSAPSELVFDIDESRHTVDVETGSIWDVTRGVAVEGPLKGAVLQQIPYVTSFDWA